MKSSKKAFLLALIVLLAVVGIGISQQAKGVSAPNAKEPEKQSEKKALQDKGQKHRFDAIENSPISGQLAEQAEAETKHASYGSRFISEMFEKSSLDNTWLFGGGAETQGRFAELGGIRSYIGHFEEYVRWVKRVDDELYGMQRYTVNAGKEGQDAAEFAGRLEDLIEKTDPKAVSYLVGQEDYRQGSSGILAFQTAISKIIEISLQMREGQGFVVIQLPHAAQAQFSQDASLYAKAAKEAFEAAAAADGKAAERMLLVDHASGLDQENFVSSMLTGEGYLNAEGHYEIAKQFTQAVYGSIEGFPSISGSWQAEPAPVLYPDILPEVKASADSLTVFVPDYPKEAGFRYTLSVDGVLISALASGNPFTVEHLPSGKEYELLLWSADGSAQFIRAAGKIAPLEMAKEPPLSSLQQSIRQMASEKSRSLTWLFMGDSITHAAAHTKGYDGVAQLFEKYVKEDLGRTEDLVINTSVSGATAERTLEHIEQRMVKYCPDIVFLMLGTNDSMYSDIYSGYQENLKGIVEKIRSVNSEAVIVFRSPVPASGEYAEDAAGEDGSVARMERVAKEDGNILFIDQYTEWNKETSAYSYLFDAAHYFGDGGLHPGAAGHVRMAAQLIRECGLFTNTKIANLSYAFSYIQSNSKVTPEVRVSGSKDTVTVPKRPLESAFINSGGLGGLTAVLTDSSGKTYTKSIDPDESQVRISGLPTDRYTLKVTAKLKGNSPKIVTFAEQEVDLHTGETVRLNEEEAESEERETKEDGTQTEADRKEQKEDTFESGKFIYKTVSETELTAELVMPKNKNLKKADIPDTVSWEKRQYRVVSIAESAFLNQKKLTDAVIGKNVLSIGKKAFAGCSQLKQIKIQGSHLQRVGNQAFLGISKKAVVSVPAKKYQEYVKLLANKGFRNTVKFRKKE